MKNLESVAKILTNIIVTFFQAGFAVWATSGFNMDKLAIGASVGAGISAVWNILIKPLLKSKGWIK